MSWLQNHLFTCVYKEYFGLACPGCGFQRSLILLLQGNLKESILLYPALIPILGLFVFLFLHIIFKFEKGTQILLVWFIIDAIIIFVSYFFNYIL